MSEKKNLEKNILVIPTKKINLHEGFIEANKNYILSLIDDSEYKLRNLMEKDTNYQQLIPYIAIKNRDKILTYQRSKTGGENRLYEKYSLGVGGHIDEPDNLITAAIREIKEEIDIDITETMLNFVGLINITETEVDRVHIGIAIIVEIEENLDFNKGEIDKIINRNFDSIQELDKKKEKFEPWSRIFFDKYIKKIL